MSGTVAHRTGPYGVDNMAISDREIFKSCALVTAAYVAIYAGILIFQGVFKIKLTITCAKNKHTFDRYNDPRMLAADRAVGNTLEWMPVFLTFFWLSMFLSNGETINYGWIYVFSRALYPFVALNGGIGRVGAKAPILLSTVPQYIVLIALAKTTFLNLL